MSTPTSSIFSRSNALRYPQSSSQFLTGYCKVSFARPRSKATTNANLYIRNLPPHADDATLFQWFSSHGPIIQARVLRNADGSSRGVGFVHFDQHEHAMLAIHRLNNVQLPGCVRPLMVKFAQKGEDGPATGPMHGVRHHHHHHHHHHGPFPGSPSLSMPAGSSLVGPSPGLPSAPGMLRSYSTPVHGHSGYQTLPNAYPPYGHSYPGHSYAPYMPLGHSTEYHVPYAGAATAPIGRH
jgi:hypothetical protein